MEVSPSMINSNNCQKLGGKQGTGKDSSNSG